MSTAIAAMTETTGMPKHTIVITDVDLEFRRELNHLTVVLEGTVKPEMAIVRAPFEMRDIFQGAMEQLNLMWSYQPTKRLGHGVVPRQDTGTPIMMSAEKIKQKIVPIMRTMVANNPRASELTFGVVDGIKTTQYHMDPKFMTTLLELSDVEPQNIMDWADGKIVVP